MNNSEWINDIRTKMADNEKLLNNFNKYADIFEKYSKFTPEFYISFNTSGKSYYSSIHWSIKNTELIVNLGDVYTFFYKVIKNHSVNEPYIYTSIFDLKESDFPEPDVKIVHGEQL